MLELLILLILLDMAAYAHRIVTFVDGKIAKDEVNQHPTIPNVADTNMSNANKAEVI